MLQLRNLRAFACCCVPSEPLLLRRDGLFYFLAYFPIMGCYFAVLVLVLVLSQKEKGKTLGDLFALGIHGMRKTLNV